MLWVDPEPSAGGSLDQFPLKLQSSLVLRNMKKHGEPEELLLEMASLLTTAAPYCCKILSRSSLGKEPASQISRGVKPSPGQ